MILNTLFILCLLLMWWCFQGYFIYLRQLKPRIDLQAVPAGPAVAFFSILVPVRNEEGIIAAKIENLKKIDYSYFEVIFIDASTDDTANIIRDKIRNIKNFQLISADRYGRSSQLNLGLSRARGEFILVTDADSCFEPNALFVLDQLFRNEKLGVIGAWVEPGTGYDPDLVFWKFYNNTRYLESMSGLCSVISGAGYAFRRSVINVIPDDVWADDVYVPLTAHMKGMLCVCVHFMKACEHRGPLSFLELLRNKVRKAADIIKEFFRFLPYFNKMQTRWRIIYITKLFQIVLSPFLSIILLMLCGSMEYFFSFSIILFLILLFQRSVIGFQGRKKVGVIETIFVFIFTEIVLLLAISARVLPGNKVYYER